MTEGPMLKRSVTTFPVLSTKSFKELPPAAIASDIAWRTNLAHHHGSDRAPIRVP